MTNRRIIAYNMVYNALRILIHTVLATGLDIQLLAAETTFWNFVQKVARTSLHFAYSMAFLLDFHLSVPRNY